MVDPAFDPLRILLIEDNLADARLTRELLRDTARFSFELVEIGTFEGGLARLRAERFDIILLDLSLGDAIGVPMVTRLCREHPILPVIVLTGLEDEVTALAAIREGAQDYLIKGQGDGHLIGRSIRYAIERKRIDRQLIEAKQTAEAANRAKTAFLATMSHELRTPLNAIIGFSEMIEKQMKGPLPEIYHQYGGYVRRSGEHLLSIINDILDIAKLQSGKAELNLAAVDIRTVVAEAISIISDTATSAAIAVAVDLPAQAAIIQADGLRLRQVILNLLSNALKFTPAGGSIAVSSCVVKDELCIVVQDTGIGMMPEDIPRALEPFTQVGTADCSVREGTGLGLPISKTLVELHGGRLDIASTPNLGTAVTISLPMPLASRCTVIDCLGRSSPSEPKLLE